ncbi:uncharacterized protein B0T15DRAFT_510665 [Chaetomium strumarium]|uniref:NAD(P)-binding protein n=1 Tax=Chaetomium strumarium TaxID=1170767 RepID=A0AAJ0M3H9_9PEZI|nr:hypothetical protein B0T15DRAFT_510665 [Chaetomium strumarium]
MAQTIVLISGANRGLGRAFLETFLSRPNHTVIAANRDPAAKTSQELLSLPAAEGSKVIVVKVDATAEDDAAAAVTELQEKHGIDHIDTVIANAAVAWVIPTVSQLKIADLKEHMETNVHGVVRLYQAVLPLLKRSAKPVWVSMGSESGYLTNFLSFPNAAYGPTKVVLHWLTCAIHTEEPTITAFVVDPGRAQTDMGNRGAKAAGELFGIPELTQAEIPVDVSIGGLVKVIDAATRETHSGKLWNYKGEQVPW